jgi:hypothetical protein
MFADLLSHDFIVCVPPLFSSFQLPLMLLKTETLGSLHSDKTKTVSQGETVVVPTKKRGNAHDEVVREQVRKHPAVHADTRRGHKLFPF